MLVLNAAAQSAFRTSTLNTVLDRFPLENLQKSDWENLKWEKNGEGVLIKHTNSSSYFFDKNTFLQSIVFNGKDFKSLSISVSLLGKQYISTSSCYSIEIVYADNTSDVVEIQNADTETAFTYRTLVFREIKPLDFRIRITSAFNVDEYNSRMYIGSVTVKGQYNCPPVSVISDTTKLELNFEPTFNSYTVDVMTRETFALGRDTLFFCNFDNFQNKYYFLYGSGKDISYKIPLLNSFNDVDKINISLKVGLAASNDNGDDVIVLYNNNEVARISRKKYESPSWNDVNLNFSVEAGYIDTLSFVVKANGNNKNYLLLDDVCVYWNTDYKYVSLPGYPMNASNEFIIENLDCNVGYRLLFQGFRVNDFGEDVVTDVIEQYVKTTGESIVLKPGEDKDMNGDFYGSIMMGNNSNLNGKFKVMGEFCYLFEYEQGHWESLTLPFKPYLIGAFINGEPVYLRENIDFHLHEYVYSSDDDKYKFLPSTDMKEYAGYLLKVPENIKYDDNVLFFYSDKKISLNDDRKYNLDGLLFAQLGNPYTYSLGDDAWNVFGYDCIYKYDGNKFVLFTVNDIIKPFESVIIYTGSPNTMPKYISIEDEVTSLEDGFIGSDVLMAVYNNAVSFYKYIGYIKIYDINGLLIYDDYISDGSQLYLEHGIYIVEFNGFKRKIVI